DPACPTSPCHRWDQEKDIGFSIPENLIVQHCPPKECPENTCCPPPPAGSGPPGGRLGGMGGWGSRGPAPDEDTADGTTGSLMAAKAGPNPTLGRFWSHAYGERILVRESPSHVWLFTADALYVEFWDVNGDGTFDKASPSHVRSVLTDTGSGWQLRALDGTVKEFNAAGQWTATRDRNGNTTSGVYSTGLLEQVNLPDGRRFDYAYHADGLLASITEVGVGAAMSRTWSYTWDGRNLTRIDRPDGTAWLLRYDDPVNPGYVTRKTLRGTDGSERIDAAREFDSFGNLVRKWRGDTSATGPNATEVFTYSYTRPWNPNERRETDPLNNLSIMTYLRDPDSNIALATSTSGTCSSCGAGPNTQQLYDDPANPTKVTRSIDVRGTVTLFEYDGNGQLISRTEALGTDLERTTTWKYHPTYPGLVTETEEPSTSGSGVRRTSWTYDLAGNATIRTEEGVENGSAFSYQAATTYNAAGRPQTIDPPGYGAQDQTVFSYDAGRGNLILRSQTDPLIGTTSFDYDALNRRTSVMDVNGVTAETTYDALDRITSVIQEGSTMAQDLVTSYVYNPFGQILRTFLPEGNVIEYGYDSVGRLVTVERKPDVATHAERTFYVLNGFGQRVRMELQRWDGGSWQAASFTDYVYNSSCNLDRIVHADGSATEYAYDCEGRLEQQWDANHPSNGQQNPPTKHYSFDDLGRLTTVTQPWGGTGGGNVTIRYDHDVQDNLVKVTDGNGTVTSYTYGDRDLLTEETSEVSGTTNSVYNEHGQMTRDTDSRGVTALRTLDVLDRVIFVDYPEDELDISYIYDDPAVLFSKGRLTAITRDGESIDYRYDRFGRRAQDGALSYNYDRNGNRRTVAYPGGVVATYTYDYADRQSSLAIQKDADPAQAIVAAASYEPFGPLSSLALGNGLSEIRRFNARYLLSEIEMADVLNWSYATDAMGNVLAITDQNDPAPSRVYGYQDYQYYLTSGVGPWGALGWTYDRLGNRLTETRDGATTSYIYTSNVAGNSSPILKSTLADGPNDSPTRYGYDASGSLTQESRTDSRIRYRYNSAKRLSEILRDSANQAPSKTQIRYDGRSFLNDSTLKQFPGSQTREWSTRATYTSDGVLHHRSIERHATPASPRGSPTTRGDDYIFYFAGRPVAQLGFRTMTLVTQTDTTESLLYLTTDHLGTPILATAEARNVEWGGGLEPFGADYSGAAEAGIFLRFPGQWEDSTWENSNSDAGAPYNIFRWYRNNLGSYTRPDPMGLDAGENLYLYTLARPTVLYDTDGRIPFAVAVVVVDLGIISSAYAGCALVQFENANRIGNSQGWRYAHCMAACWLRKTCGLSKKVAGGFGYLNEIKQSYECKRAVVIDGSLSEDVPACRSAFAPVDLDEDNPLGFNCPDDVRCETNCESLKGKSKKRDQFGPYYHWAP
ncbi:MAG: RHS repeat protein, partial [bacterium]|nr:RHS repeat protein [bacterium]